MAGVTTGGRCAGRVRLGTMVHFAMVLHHHLAVLVHLGHLLGMVLMLLAGRLLLAVIHALVLGIGIGSLGRLAKGGNSERERNRADKRLHLKISEKSEVQKQLLGFRPASEGASQSPVQCRRTASPP